MLNLFTKLIDSNQQALRRFAQKVKEVNLLEEEIAKLSDSQLKKRTEELKKKHLQGATLDQLLAEAFAVVREASKRVNDARLFDVQLIAAAALHEGKISEQKTGEGKTFSASPAAYLNALTDRGIHIITVNDYLARRECGWVGPVYYALGISCATIIHEQAFLYDPDYIDKDTTDERLKHLRPITRKEAYGADITYGTNNEFGFDYLRDNMALSLESQVQRGHYFAIVDEVDSILIDEARTPLIISAPAQEPTEKYAQFAKLIEKMSAQDYILDEKMRTVHLTDAGTLKIEKLLGIDNLYEKDFSTLHHIEEALKAKTLFQKDKDYVVKDGEVIIVDEFTGRLMPGRRYSEGLHQAIEAKEGVTIQQESQTMATISFQNYFRMYEKLSGMTGTAATEAEEFHKIYKLDVIVVPTNRPMVRKDLPDSIYKTELAKYTAVVEDVAKLHESGQPVLVGTTSIEKNEFLSKLLKKKGISHALLNAKNHEKEAEIISKAGEKGAVTVATNMAGRGVDIKLSVGVNELGGLYVVGTERHESRRIDNQLRGRSGRQGDSGASKFYVSLEDDLMRIFGGEQVARVMEFLKIPDDMPIENGLVSKAIEGAQRKVEGHNFDARKHTVEYDDVMNQQRQIVYGVRNQILQAMATNSGITKEKIQEKIQKEIASIVTIHSTEVADIEKIAEEFVTIIPFDTTSREGLVGQLRQIDSSEAITEQLTKIAADVYEMREKELGADVCRQMESFVYLNTIDTLWLEHLDTIDDLRVGIGLRGYAQRDPLVEYKKEAFDLFSQLMDTIDSDVVHRIYKISVNNQLPSNQPMANLDKALEIHQEALEEENLLEEVGHLTREIDQLEIKEKPVVKDLPYVGTKVTIERAGGSISTQNYGEKGQLTHQKIGRNDPCPCGSGLKWKKCGLIGASQHRS
ncbi:preprotein translocase subunit SecA [Candidatus Daviesbacteria bacterium RIFCSPHIGHO2_01_FULL_44_29]|uniref:Protein translocase subunit SecA n=1 Tax=Candidatus Daviesbacteria bacterium RIFCSPHIGHO2_02_FULL_43_12 TaxID=1797776 RepID=A0A1F5KKD5_9BACT|nr:MAG: preprotein translocase subunit SecA [Candidatus Daviesbacteria bacterium RIFCSPHIGHO2_01_FULL_44_29]OGE40303.1 MAG: preprotein translocase subunit SecA [Candidatus Daviesbacteria bacterium RIFCSPHIGHO2_12_FULL_47_45]OGE41397.1 MAG: preprotein translocase subunit SecA [Candidatus Daviesbacteria bacterium RIFCSPHIGHO2_02_FULL_43_12]OGE69598.1 MAG: preprotein translocase subunit SecA [Candidatus Daviesbacteria bacterium RIFCSPLOWO2_01_FULL_43_15]